MPSIRVRGDDVLRWTPRVLCILFAIFISLFALDAFNEGASIGRKLVAFSIHLIPTLIVILALLVAWRWEAAGGILLLALAVWYAIGVWGRFPLATITVISGPLVVAGCLFLIDWGHRTKLRRGA